MNCHSPAPLLLPSLLLLLLITIFNITNVSSLPAPAVPPAVPSSTFSCYDHNCSLIEESDKLQNLNQTVNSDNMFVIDLDCQITKVGFCEKVKRNLNITGQIITKAINLKVPVVLKISFKPLGEETIGQAGPSRLIGLKSGDGIVRLYPQALVKQFQLKAHPEFLPADIKAEFNSDFDFWFEGDATPIKPTETGFVYIALHEFIHGLGFLSYWGPSPYSGTVNATELVPYASITTAITNATATPQTPTSQNSSIIFNGFYESIFDKLITLLPSGMPLTNFTNELNKFAPKGTKFDSEDDFYAKFQNSTQYKIATDMLKHATTPLSFGLLKKGFDFQDIVVNNTANDQLFYLETNINPYKSESSVSHASQELYLKSTEFLMTFQGPPGKTLKDAIKDGGSYVGGAIGPKLLSIFESLGYATADNPNPEIPTLIDPPLYYDAFI